VILQNTPNPVLIDQIAIKSRRVCTMIWPCSPVYREICASVQLQVKEQWAIGGDLSFGTGNIPNEY
jgi:hypothetical protein